MNTVATPSFSTGASIYVGDLHPDVTEAILFEKFTQIGPVTSIRVCRDVVTRRSLGYAYVNFQQHNHAEQALDTYMFEPLRGRPMRLMWSQRDPTLRKSGVGNIFIKNLDKDIDTKALYDTFSSFGNILSCKIVLDEKGESKGYGFVHFDGQESAQRAIDKVNNMRLNDKIVFVGPFLTREERLRLMGDRNRRFTNVYVKNFGEALDDEKLSEMFSKFGTITSAKVMKDHVDESDSKIKGFGFVNFEDAEAASRAVAEMNGLKMEDNRELYVGRAQKKSERQAELRRMFEDRKRERMQRFTNVNLYVKNLDDVVDDERLRKEFDGFGPITSAKVMVNDTGRSRGFGFVCFNSPEEATRAISEMNGRIIGTKPLYVALAQRKEERRAYLSTYFAHRTQTTPYMANRLPGSASGNFMAPYQQSGLPASFIMAAQPSVGPFGTAAAVRQQGFGNATNGFAQMGGRGPAGTQFPPAMLAFQQQQQQQIQQQMQQFGRPMGRQGQQGTMGMGAPFMTNGGMSNVRAQMMRGQGGPGSQQMSQMTRPMMAGRPQQSLPFGTLAGGPMGRFGQQQPMQMTPQQQQQMMAAQAAAMRAGGQGRQMVLPSGQAIPMRSAVVPSAAGAGGASGAAGDQEPLTLERLANAPPREQKQMLGDRLYPLVARLADVQLAGKITGMLLELDNAELLHLLESDNLLHDKVEEAVQVWRQHSDELATSSQAGPAAEAPSSAVSGTEPTAVAAN